MQNENTLTYIDENGNEVLCEILFTFDSDEFGKSYVVFYPMSDSDEDEIEVMAASYTTENGEVGELQEVETDEEWDLIQDVLNQFESDVEESEEDEE